MRGLHEIRGDGWRYLPWDRPRAGQWAGTTIGAGLVAMLSGCAQGLLQDMEPATITLTGVPVYVLDGDEHGATAAVATKDGTPLPQAPTSLAFSPPSVGAITSTGHFRCLATGDGVITATSGVIVGSQDVKCRLVSRLKVPESLRVVLRDGRVPLAAEVHDEHGAVIEDVPVEFHPEDPGIAGVEEGKVVPVRIGRTKVESRAGKQSAATVVEVIDRIETGPLSVSDGGSVTYALDPGSYLVDVKAEPAGGGGYGVELGWVGAGCEPQPERQHHEVACRLGQPASLVVHNPSMLGMGPAQVGVISIYQVP
ncbi:hypothetical protein L6R50_28055 [Myxococcota bacterium]|nr:hypothetical protein [Myxococcota bacterium]